MTAEDAREIEASRAEIEASRAEVEVRDRLQAMVRRAQEIEAHSQRVMREEQHAHREWWGLLWQGLAVGVALFAAGALWAHFFWKGAGG